MRSLRPLRRSGGSSNHKRVNATCACGPEPIRRLSAQGYDRTLSSPEELGALSAAGVERMGKVIREAGIKAGHGGFGKWAADAVVAEAAGVHDVIGLHAE